MIFLANGTTCFFVLTVVFATAACSLVFDEVYS
ncbi:unnamed protein product [Ectocarpus sp. 6 AP-2014]